MTPSKQASMRVAEKIFHKEGYIRTPETPIANAFRDKRIAEVADMIDSEFSPLVEALNNSLECLSESQRRLARKDFSTHEIETTILLTNKALAHLRRK
jgi:hypothetical protein